MCGSSVDFSFDEELRCEYFIKDRTQILQQTALYTWETRKIAHICSSDAPLLGRYGATTYINDRHNLQEVLLGINPKEGQMGEGGGGAHTCSSLGHMATPERQAVKREGSVHRWGRLCGGGFRGSLVLLIRGE